MLDTLVYNGIVSPERYDWLMSLAHIESQVFVLGISILINNEIIFTEHYEPSEILLASYLSAVIIMNNEDCKKWYFERNMRDIGALDKSIDPNPEGNILRFNFDFWYRKIDDETWGKLSSIQI